jgi:ankyrin repeat protein
MQKSLTQFYRLAVVLIAGFLIFRLYAKTRRHALVATLEQAMRTGNIKGVEGALESGADVDSRGSGGDLLLDEAASVTDPTTQASLLNVMLEHSHLPADVRTTAGLRLLCYAAWCGRADIVQRLLARGADLDTDSRLSPLAFAIVHENTDMAKLLLDHGANIHAVTFNATIPALMDGNSALLKLLIDHGLDVNARQQVRQRFPVPRTAQPAPYSPSPSPATTLQPTSDDPIAMCYVTDLERRINDAIDSADNYVARITARDGMTALMWAVINMHTGQPADHVALIRLLLARGAEVNAADSERRTALHYALAADTDANNPAVTEVVNLLLTHGADVRAVNINGVTSVMYAAIGNHPALVRKMLDAGVDINTRDRLGASVLLRVLYANGYGSRRRSRSLDLAPLLLAHGANVQILSAAAVPCREEDLQFLLDHGADIDGRDEKGNTALANAAAVGYLPTVRFLLAHGAHIDLKNRHGQTALMLAAFRTGTADTVQYLLANGADPRMTDVDGRDALHYLVQSVQQTNVERVLKMGIDPNHRDRRGRTPLLAALNSFRPTTHVIQLLLDHGADANARDNDGMTPMRLALTRGLMEIAAQLKQAGAHLP